jgi:hypothetical protein
MEPKVEGYVEMMRLWGETAKNVTQLVAACLLLPVFFLRDILGVPAQEALLSHLSPWLLSAWLCFGLSIAIGTTYQMTVARLIGDAYSGTRSRDLCPNQQFWAMAGTLALGIVCFLAAFATAR